MSSTPALVIPQSLREEAANALSHGLGCLLAAASLPVLLASGWLPARPGSVVGAAVFALTMTLVYLASTVYHALPPGRAKQWLNRVDHAAIFLFIAGSFTPFALRNLDSDNGLVAFGLVWLLALLGIVCKAGGGLRCPLRSTLLYVALGWVAAAAALPTLAVLSAGQILLIAGGGAAYMVGAVFFLIDHRLRYSHFIWHLFVLAGSGCHFTAALQHLA
ncbi:MAG: hemolysin III family protein [Rubrivivax sp.]|jgi:hemolysin III|nr:hemolysin III family protein [Rubrivivax sp.]